MDEPILVDIDELDGSRQDFTVAEYLPLWGGDAQYDRPPAETGDGHVFYDASDPRRLGDAAWLAAWLAPALRRWLKEDDRKPQDRSNMEAILAWAEWRIAEAAAGRPLPPVRNAAETFRVRGREVTYGHIRQRMKDTCAGLYRLQLSKSAYTGFAAAVNQGIDSRLEACFVPERGDSLRGRTVRVSNVSLPVLVRRLAGGNADQEDLAVAILASLDINID